MPLLSTHIRRGFVVGALCACAPALHAQGRTFEDRKKLPQNVAPMPTSIAPIDPAARDLVARALNRYLLLDSFETLITRTKKFSGPGYNPTSETEFTRIQLGSQGQFVASDFSPPVLWFKSIYDGKNRINFSSTSGNRYSIDRLRFPANVSARQRVAQAIGEEGPMVWFATAAPQFTAMFVNPLLTRFDMQSDGDLQKVTMKLSYKKDTDSAADFKVPEVPSQIELWIDPKTLTLDHARTLSNTTIGDFVEIETYSQTRYNPKFDPKLFRVAAPKGYVRESSWLD